uniref:Golgin-84 n=1 Tax=Romanomermis culicivorax TaxID=13658 RepID=A0A915IK20_ROMCU
MSWLADIAGRAEGLLNQLDQTAATALQKTSRSPSLQSFGATTTIPSEVMSPSTSDLRSIQKDQKPSYASSLSSFPSRQGVAMPSREEMETERLMEYLNDNDSHSSFNKFSRKSSSSSLRSLPIVVQQSTFIGQSLRTEATPTNEVELQKSSPVEKNLIEYKAREQDYQKALQAKDGQLAVLRIRLQDVDQQLHLRNERLKKLERDQEKYCIARIQRLELEQSGTLQQLTSVQKGLTEEKIRCNEFAEQLKLAKYNLESNKLEFDEYKQKATKILQSKEKLIATLKNEEGASATSSENTNLLIQLEELKTERDLLKEDLQQAHLQLYNLRNETQELESQLAQEQRANLEQQRSLQDQCQTYQQSSAQYREQYEQLKQDYQCVQDELRRQHLVLQNKLREKDTEIARLINQVAQRTPKSANENEQDLRIKQLTENLIQKQTVIEALQTDKQSLNLQLERLEKLYREAESAAIRASSSSVIDMGANEDVYVLAYS